VVGVLVVALVLVVFLGLRGSGPTSTAPSHGSVTSGHGSVELVYLAEPSAQAPVVPAMDTHRRATGDEWTENGYELWIDHVWAPTLEQVGLTYQRPYDLRHSFASLLLHEGRSAVYVTRQLGHSTAVCMRAYSHVIEELDDAPRITAEDAILKARRGGDVGSELDQAR